MRPFSLPSFAKINLHLSIGEKRSDGFHDITTVFQSVSLTDTITFEAGDGIQLGCDDPRMLERGNIIVRAANLLRSEFAVGPGAKLTLVKRIPFPGGLGGGSSNAAVTLIGLSRLWGLDLDPGELLPLAIKLGADVPFFLYGGTMLGTGRGDELEPIHQFQRDHLLIVTPGIEVRTERAFAAFDSVNLTKKAPQTTLEVCRPSLVWTGLQPFELQNDFETSVLHDFPEISRVKQRLITLGAQNAMLSGSGASVFGIFDKEETRQTAYKALDDEINWRKFAVTTISREQYREALDLV